MMDISKELSLLFSSQHPTPVVKHPASNFPFMQLPTELRVMIYNCVLLLSNSVVPPLLYSPRDYMQHTGFHAMKLNVCPPGFFNHERQIPNVTCAGLLRCSRQVHAEMSEVLETRMRKENGCTYQLDCLAQKDNLYATWTCMPAPLRFVRNIELTLHIRSPLDVVTWYGDFRWTTNTSKRLRNNLIELLTMLANNGPTFANIAHGNALNIESVTIIILPDDEEDGAGPLTAERRQEYVGFEREISRGLLQLAANSRAAEKKPGGKKSFDYFLHGQTGYSHF